MSKSTSTGSQIANHAVGASPPSSDLAVRTGANSDGEAEANETANHVGGASLAPSDDVVESAGVGSDIWAGNMSANVAVFDLPVLSDDEAESAREQNEVRAFNSDEAEIRSESAEPATSAAPVPLASPAAIAEPSEPGESSESIASSTSGSEDNVDSEHDLGREHVAPARTSACVQMVAKDDKGTLIAAETRVPAIYRGAVSMMDFFKLLRAQHSLLNNYMPLEVSFSGKGDGQMSGHGLHVKIRKQDADDIKMARFLVELIPTLPDVLATPKRKTYFGRTRYGSKKKPKTGEYVVAGVIAHRNTGDRWEFLTQWSGNWPNSWQPISSFYNGDGVQTGALAKYLDANVEFKNSDSFTRALATTIAELKEKDEKRA